VPRERGTDNASLSWKELENLRRHTRTMKELNGQTGRQWRLLGRLRNHRIAGRQRGGNLARENGERKGPGADAREYSPAARAKGLALPGGPAQHTLAAEIRASLGRVVPEEIDCFAHFGDTVRQRLAGFERAAGEKLSPIRFEGIRRFEQNARALVRAQGI